MRRPRHEIEAEVPSRAECVPDEASPRSLPQIRRQLERICEALGVEYGDLKELHIRPGIAQVTRYDRDENGDLYRDEADNLAIRRDRLIVDTVTFIGDERDF